MPAEAPKLPRSPSITPPESVFKLYPDSLIEKRPEDIPIRGIRPVDSPEALSIQNEPEIILAEPKDKVDPIVINLKQKMHRPGISKEESLEIAKQLKARMLELGLFNQPAAKDEDVAELPQEDALVSDGDPYIQEVLGREAAEMDADTSDTSNEPSDEDAGVDTLISQEPESEEENDKLLNQLFAAIIKRFKLILGPDSSEPNKVDADQPMNNDQDSQDKDPSDSEQD